MPQPTPSPTEPAAGPAAAGPVPRRRRGRALRAFLVVLAVLAGAAAGGLLAWSRPDLFGTREAGGPALLRSIQNLSRFEAATGTFQVVVDLERDAPFLPDVLKGTRTLFVGVGGVDAYVDFTGLTAGAVTVSPDRETVTVRLPPARLEKPNLDHRRSYVFAQERGLLDRIQDALSSSPADQRELYLLAERRIAEAAAASDLRRRAEQNTKAMLEGMLASLGFDTVVVEYAAAP